jgi:hypothetical protein
VKVDAPETAPGAALEAELERELAIDHALRRRIDIGAWIVALFTIATYLTLIMPMGRTSPFLILLSLYAIATRIGAYVSLKAFEVPRFLVRLDDADPGVRTAARAVFDRHRAAILRPILMNRLESYDAAAIAAVPPERAAQIAREYGIEARRRLGRLYFAVWCVVSVAIWTTLVVTGGGPTD